MPTLSRQELYDLVWSEPVRTVAKTFDLSDSGLRKVCQSAFIPLPERGYWARLAAGKSVVRVRLSPRGPGMPDLVTFGSAHPWVWPPDPVAELAEPPPSEPVFAEALFDLEVRVRKQVGRVAITRSLSDAHSLVRRLVEADEKRRTSADKPFYISGLDAPIFGSAFEQRRLKVLSAVLFGLSKAGMKPLIRGRPARDLSVTVGAQHVSFTLDHPLAKPDRHRQAVTRDGKADTLSLRIERFPEDSDRPSLWTDNSGLALESQLTEIVVGLIPRGRNPASDRRHGALPPPTEAA